MKVQAKKINYKGEECIELTAGGYQALVAPFLGSNIIRLYHIEKDIDILRYEEDITMDELKSSAETHGLPTLYLPNRLAGGILKTSDAQYQFPINEPAFNTHLHGFLHKRAYQVVDMGESADFAYVKTEYIYDDKDECYSFYPVSFKAEMTIKLSDKGLEYKFTMTNLSNVQMPFGVCSHTAFFAPFTKGGDGMNVHLYVPIGDRCEIDDKYMATEELLPLDDHDRQYLTGSLIPVHQPIDTEMYFGVMGEKDGQPFYGAVATDTVTGDSICYEVDEAYKFFIMWNEWGEKGYFCVEPQTWMVNAPNLSLLPETTGYKELAPSEYASLTQRVYLSSK